MDGSAWWMNITKGDAMAAMASTLTSTEEFLHRRQRPYAGKNDLVVPLSA